MLEVQSKYIWMDENDELHIIPRAWSILFETLIANNKRLGQKSDCMAGCIRQWRRGINQGLLIFSLRFKWFNHVCKCSDLKLDPSTYIQIWKDTSILPNQDTWQSYLNNITNKGHVAILSSPWYINFISYGYQDWYKLYQVEPFINFTGKMLYSFWFVVRMKYQTNSICRQFYPTRAFDWRRSRIVGWICRWHEYWYKHTRRHLKAINI